MDATSKLHTEMANCWTGSFAPATTPSLVFNGSY